MFYPCTHGHAAGTHSPGHRHEPGLSAAFRELTFALFCPFLFSFIPSFVILPNAFFFFFGGGGTPLPKWNQHTVSGLITTQKVSF